MPDRHQCCFSENFVLDIDAYCLISHSWEHREARLWHRLAQKGTGSMSGVEQGAETSLSPGLTAGQGFLFPLHRNAVFCVETRGSIWIHYWIQAKNEQLQVKLSSGTPLKPGFSVYVCNPRIVEGGLGRRWSSLARHPSWIRNPKLQWETLLVFWKERERVRLGEWRGGQDLGEQKLWSEYITWFFSIKKINMKYEHGKKNTKVEETWERMTAEVVFQPPHGHK